jgi:hypothetical protein
MAIRETFRPGHRAKITSREGAKIAKGLQNNFWLLASNF